MRLLFIGLSLLCSTSFACEITLPENLLIVSEEEFGQHPITAKNCSPEAMRDTHLTVSSLEGRITAHRLSEMMKYKGHENVIIQPQLIQVQQLKTLMREQMSFPAGVQVKSTNSLNSPNIIALNSGDKIVVQCDQCLYGTKQALNLTLVGFDGTRSSFTATADFRKMVRAYRVVHSLPSFASIDSAVSLKEEFVDAVPHTDLITETDTLKFYKTNKPLRTGELLKLSDLNALNLVKAGLRTDVIMENQVIRIKTQAISRSNGTLGEFVEVFHPQKNKKYQGKVVDVNKVLVEL